MLSPRAAILIILILFLNSCGSREVTKELAYLQGMQQNDIIILLSNCYYIENPGSDDLVPVEKLDQLQSYQRIAGVVLSGTQIKFLGSFEKWAYMSDTHIYEYGRIIDGEFQGQKISLSNLINEQRKLPVFYKYEQK